MSQLMGGARSSGFTPFSPDTVSGTGTLNKFVNERLENSMQNRYKVMHDNFHSSNLNRIFMQNNSTADSTATDNRPALKDLNNHNNVSLYQQNISLFNQQF